MLTVRYDLLGLRSGETLLDLGSGNGRHAFEALRRGARVIAADIDDTSLKDVKALAAAMEIEGQASDGSSCGCTVADALRLPFADSSFDRIVACEILEHIPRDERAMAEIARVCKPGATVAVSVPRTWPEAVCWLLSKRYHSNEGGHVRIYRRGQLLGRLRRAGLRPVRTHHAHALHSPLWWLRCLFGPDRDTFLPRAYHRFLVWDIESPNRFVRMLERVLDPVMGKSLVIYLKKPGSR